MKFTASLFILFSTLLFTSTISVVFSQLNSAEIYKDVKKFGVLASVLYVAAHPDDENTRMISYLSNHLSANTTYLSLTRGDGGQNLIGSEIREMLGIIRTHELLEARKIDGGSQMFTRANDFGFSKSPAETFNIWDRKEVLSDIVWAIRKIQPDVIINRFNTDITRPNHGHHTASAILSNEAFDLASDKKAFPEQLQYVDPWQPRRIYFNTSWFFFGSREDFEKADKSNMVRVDIGAFDQVKGESNSEIAGRSRSMHKSQGFGSAETRGESMDYFDLIKDTKGIVPKTIFDGIDITWNRIPGASGIANKAKELDLTFDFRSPSKSIPLLLDIHQSILALPDSYWKQVKLSECEKLIRNCMGLFIELRTSQFRSSPGTIIPVTLEVINRSEVEVILDDIVSPTDSIISFKAPLAYNQVFLKDIQFEIPDKLSIPYWLKELPKEGMYTVSDQTMRGKPSDPPAVMAQVHFNIAGQKLKLEVPVIYKIIDPAEGEIYRPIFITPPVTVDLESNVLVFAQGQERSINVTMTSVKDSVSGILDFKIAEPGWKVTPDQIPFSFSRSGESIAITCIVAPPDFAAEATLQPEIIIGDKSYHHTITTIDYEHLPFMSIVRDASVKLKSLDIKIIQRPIAYIEGAGDDVDKALEQLGYNVDIVDPGNISMSLLNKYQVVILGIRAYNTVEELAYKNKILFDWV
ncbi:MAG TPA: PIG-L family deacetylase, partial [Saprospiraceae bacterium]|nr:PIG-L family deacetylase [Saprospiraceae bacterium]